MKTKRKYFFYYGCSALIFEASISELLVLIGMVFLKNSEYYYYFFLSAFLGGLWSYRLHYMYKIMNETSDKSDTAICEYFEERVFGTKGHKLRMDASKPLLISVVIFLVILYCWN